MKWNPVARVFHAIVAMIAFFASLYYVYIGRLDSATYLLVWAVGIDIKLAIYQFLNKGER